MPRTGTRHNANPSKLYLEAMRALERLALSEGASRASDLLADVTEDMRRDDWAKAHKLKQTTGHACVTRLLKGRCNGFDCLQPPAVDHPSLWLRDGKPVVFVSQPYPLTEKAVVELGEFVTAHGLELVIDVYPAWHYPGGVLQVELWKRGVERTPQSETT